MERVHEEPPSVPGSPFLSGFMDRADTTVQHAKDIYREVKKHGIAVVLPSDQEAAEWLRRVKEECLKHLDDCLREKAEQAADELNTFRKKPREEQEYAAGGWAFDALVSTAATVVTPGGGAVASTAAKEAERAAAKRAGKAALKKAGAELGEEAVEHVDAAAANKVRKEAEKRAVKEAAEQAEREAAERAEHAATTKLEAERRARVQRMQPEPVADGAHTTFVRDPKTGKVYKYQEWDKDNMPVRRADIGSNSSRPSPHTHFPAGPDHLHTYTPPNKAPDGRVFPGQEASVRNLEPHEVPR